MCNQFTLDLIEEEHTGPIYIDSLISALWIEQIGYLLSGPRQALLCLQNVMQHYQPVLHLISLVF